MPDFSTDHLRKIIEAMHGGNASFVKSVPIYESERGRMLWNGVVQVYDLAESPSGAKRAYAWSVGLPDGQRQSFALLHDGKVTDPRKAIRAALRAD